VFEGGDSNAQLSEKEKIQRETEEKLRRLGIYICMHEVNLLFHCMYICRHVLQKLMLIIVGISSLQEIMNMYVHLNML
jgi:hypothetical protein